ncbi:MAG: ATP-binding protein [Candidatus Bathyarchaeota archaeon]|nr:ATP-binding protein [Candidatus Bathyarchaeota archaeon]
MREVAPLSNLSSIVGKENLCELFRSVIESINEAVLIIDPVDFKVVFANEEASRQFNLAKEDIVGKRCFEVSHNRSKPCQPPNDQCPMQELIKKGASTVVEHTHFDSNSNKFVVKITVHPVRDHNGKLIYVTHLSKDITEKKLLQEKILESERIGAIGDLSLTLANDLRNPLQAISNGMYLLKKNSECLNCSPNARGTILKIEEAIHYSDRIITSMINYAIKNEPILKKNNLLALIELALNQTQKPPNVELITNYQLDPMVVVDERMLTHVFYELLKNGIEAMNDRGGTLRVSTQERNGFVDVILEDTGSGISKQNFNKLFTPLFTTKSKGMGMSLANSKRIVEAHRGSIKVESEEGRGTKITVTLPVKVDTSDFQI